MSVITSICLIFSSVGAAFSLIVTALGIVDCQEEASRQAGIRMATNGFIALSMCILFIGGLLIGSLTTR